MNPFLISLLLHVFEFTRVCWEIWWRLLTSPTLSEAALARLRKAKPLPVPEVAPIMGHADPVPHPKPHFAAFRLGEKARPLR